MVVLSFHFVTLVYYYIFYFQKCEAAVVNCTLNSQSFFASDCNWTGKKSFCVPIKNCLTLITLLNETELLARKCGPSNENKRNPRVCCEKRFISLDSTLTTDTMTTITTKLTQETATTKTPQMVAINATVRRDKESELTKLLPFCGVPRIGSRILGGQPTENQEFPWLGKILTRNIQGDLNFMCTGSLITSRVVLTAAHCTFSNLEIGDLYAVSLGEFKTNCPNEDFECLLNKKVAVISSHVVHPKYSEASKNYHYDIAVIILRDKVKFTGYIAPICLQESRWEPSEYFLAGWGLTAVSVLESASNVILKTTIPPFPWEQCFEKYKTVNVSLTTNQICAGGVENVDACSGDSGGPLMVIHDNKWYIGGIVSYGNGCGKKGWPGVYTYIPSYVNWIKQVIRQNVN